MKIVSMIGFDHLPPMNPAPASEILGIDTYRDCMYFNSSGDVSKTVEEFSGRRWLTYRSTNTSPNSATTTGVNQSVRIAAGSNYDSLPKTGKWVYGIKMKTGTVYSSEFVPFVFLWNSTGSKTTFNPSYFYTTSLYPNTGYYFEVEIDWTNKVVNFWIDGQLVKTLSTPSISEFILFVGANSYNVSSTTTAVIRTVLKNNDPYSYVAYSDYYMMHIPPEELSTHSRLGSVRVVPAKISQVVKAPGWYNTDSSKSVTDLLNSTVQENLSDLESPYVSAPDDGLVAEIKFERPMTERKIHAVQIKGLMRKEDGADTIAETQFVSGTEFGESLNATLAARWEYHGLAIHLAAPDGTEWDADKVQAATLKIRTKSSTEV